MSDSLTGAGLADPQGRLLWVDDAFCAVIDRPREKLVGVDLPAVTGLGADALAQAEGADTVQLPGDEGGPALRLKPVTAADGRPLAFAVEIQGPVRGRPPAAATAAAYFVVDHDHRLLAAEGGAPGAAGLVQWIVGQPGGAAVGPLPVRDLIDRAFQGRAAVGLAIQPTGMVEVHCFPVPGPDPGGPPAGVVGVVSMLRAESPSSIDVATEPLELERGLDVTLVRKAGTMLESVAQIVVGIVGGEACGVFEYVPDGTGLVLRGAARRQAPAVDAPPDVNRPEDSGWRAGSLLVPIESPTLSGCLFVSGRDDRAFTADDERCARLAAELIGVATGLLALGEAERRAALLDPLTGLPGRLLILDHLRGAVARAARQGTGIALLFADLTRFKVVNDTLGHEAGDALLAAAADRMRSALRPSDTIGRLGGDEFLVICESLTDSADALALAHRLAAGFATPFDFSGFTVSLSASVGVAYAVGPALDGDALIVQADAAMYWAKRRGHSVAMFDQRMEANLTGPGAGRPPPVGAASPAGEPEAAIGGHLGDLVNRLIGLLGDVAEPDAAPADAC